MLPAAPAFSTSERHLLHVNKDKADMFSMDAVKDSLKNELEINDGTALAYSVCRGSPIGR
jgi:hypothetical protein